MEPVTPLGMQVLADYYACDPAQLDDPEVVCAAMLEAARRADATILAHNFHRFSPQGVSGVVIIAESHLAIHTWPEHGYAAVDLFTCGAALRADACLDYLGEVFRSQRRTVATVARGADHARGAADRTPAT